MASRSDQDAEAYQDELSEKVDDGGGCAEVWETLSEDVGSTNVSRRSVLRKAGGTATGVALASSLQAALASTARASETTSQRIENVVESSEPFRTVQSNIKDELQNRDDILTRFNINPSEQTTFGSPVVREVDIEGDIDHIATYSKTQSGKGGEPELSVEISARIYNEEVTQVNGLIKLDSDNKLSMTSVYNDTAEAKKQSGVIRTGGITTQAQQCISCQGANICFDACVAVAKVACNTPRDVCGYTTTAGCIVISAVTGLAGGAACALFFEAYCNGDLNCTSSPRRICRNSASACDDPWLK